MKRLPFDKFVFSRTNGGLGANTNAGLAATSGEYVLQLQDDWLCVGPHDFIERAIELILNRPDIGFVRLTDKETMVPEQEGHRFFSQWEAPGGRMVRVFHTPPPRQDYFVYTDTPHLKTRELVNALGPYLVSPYMQRTELDMRDRFNAQTRFKAARFEGMNVFTHIGQDQSFNRLLPMAKLGATMDRIPGVRRFAALYRSVRRRTR